MLINQKELLKIINMSSILYELNDLKCKIMKLNGIKNKLNNVYFYENKCGEKKKIKCGGGYWVWLEYENKNIFWLSDEKFNSEFEISKLRSNINKMLN